MHNEKLHSLEQSPNTIEVIKLITIAIKRRKLRQEAW
jgi:hypothetical protein